jgi:phosphatidylinositol dimannoside acyltransferase
VPGPDGTREPAYLLYRAGAAVASTLPESVLLAGAKLMGTGVARVNKRRRAVVERNLARVVAPEALDATVDTAFRSYARYWMETLRIPRPGTDEIRRRTTVEGQENLSQFLDAGQGVVFVSPHVGSYDVAAGWLAAQGWRVVAVAEEVEPPALFELFRELRRAVGVEVYPLGHASTARALLTALRDGAALGLIADRDISGSGIEVPFFGEPTWLPTGPAVLALRTGAPLCAGALYQRPGGGWHGVILDPIPVEKGRADPERVRELTIAMAGKLEELVRREPGQWHLFQPNWPSDPGYAGGAVARGARRAP